MIPRLLPVLCVVLWVLDASLPAMAQASKQWVYKQRTHCCSIRVCITDEFPCCPDRCHSNG
jgi:hypothetical protein